MRISCIWSYLRGTLWCERCAHWAAIHAITAIKLHQLLDDFLWFDKKAHYFLILCSPPIFFRSLIYLFGCYLNKRQWYLHSVNTMNRLSGWCSVFLIPFSPFSLDSDVFLPHSCLWKIACVAKWRLWFEIKRKSSQTHTFRVAVYFKSLNIHLLLSCHKNAIAWPNMPSEIFNR